MVLLATRRGDEAISVVTNGAVVGSAKGRFPLQIRNSMLVASPLLVVRRFLICPLLGHVVRILNAPAGDRWCLDQSEDPRTSQHWYVQLEEGNGESHWALNFFKRKVYSFEG
jgi:hypothetical protein